MEHPGGTWGFSFVRWAALFEEDAGYLDEDDTFTMEAVINVSILFLSL